MSQLVPVEQVGQVGIIKDTPTYSLPPNAFSDGLNVRFVDNGVEKLDGYLEVMKDCPIYPQHLVFVNQDEKDYWIVFGNNVPITRASVNLAIQLYNPSDSQWYNLTPINGIQVQSADVWSAEWNGRILYATYGGLENLYWPMGTDNKFDITKKFKSFTPKSPTNEDRKFISMYSFKSHVIGLGVNYPDYSNPYMVQWSTPMGTYEEPTAGKWDLLDDTLDAGEYELNETKGVIVGGRQLGDSFMVYKEDCVYVMNYIGPPFMFGFKVMAKDIGMLSRNGIDVFDGGHVFIGNNNVYLNNGQNIIPLLSDKLQSEMFDDISGDNYFRAFVVADKLNTEMLIAWPSHSSRHCDRGIIWNWRTGTMSLRDLPNIDHACEGVVNLTQGEKWDDTFGEWDTRIDKWGERSYFNVLQELVFAGYGDKKMYRSGTGNKADTENMYSVIERTGYDLGDPGSVKFVRAVWPKISVSGSNTVNVSVCSQMSPDDPLNWEGPYQYNPDMQSKVSCRVTGKYFGIKVESEGDFTWRLHGYEFDMDQAGRRGVMNYAV